MTRNAIVDALGVLKAGRIVDLTHLVHPGIQRFGPFPRHEDRAPLHGGRVGLSRRAGLVRDAVRHAR